MWGFEYISRFWLKGGFFHKYLKIKIQPLQIENVVSIFLYPNHNMEGI